jgi:hypothetical protein
MAARLANNETACRMNSGRRKTPFHVTETRFFPNQKVSATGNGLWNRFFKPMEAGSRPSTAKIVVKVK